MSETIKDIIFEENSTLFRILDQLQVTDIVDLKTKTSSLERDQRDIKVQLDALAIKQDNFEGTTNARLIALNTEVENINTDTSELSTKVSTLQITVESVNSSLQEETTRIDSLYARVNAQTTQISDLSDKVTNNDNAVTEMKERLAETQQTVIYLGNVVSGFSDELSQLRTDFTALQVTTANLDSKIVNITKQITTGTRVMKNTNLFVWQYQYGRMSRFTYTGNDDYMLVGKQYNSVSMTGWLSGVYNITIGMFDPSINNTYEMPRGYTVPVTSGTVYRFYYGSGSLNFSALIYT